MPIVMTKFRVVAAIVALNVAFLASAVIERPKIASDASSGMLVWSSMEHGSRWNRFFEPDPADIAATRQNFLTWWSPGQYLAVGPLHRIGLSWGAAIVAATFCCTLIGIAGFWRLYLLLGFGTATSGLAAAILSITWHVTRSYGEFPGGELPLFAAVPWLIAAILRIRPLRWWSALPFAAIYLAGAMVKLSFCVAATATVAGICLAEYCEAPTGRRFLVLATKGASMVVLGHLLLWAVFLRFGVSPGTIGAHGSPWWYVIPVAAVLPAGSVIGIGSIISRIFMFPGHPLVVSEESLAPLFWVLAAGIAFLYWALGRQSRLPGDYGRFAAGMVAGYIVLVGGLGIAGAAVSVEDRQFFPVGAVLLPAIVELALSGSTLAGRVAARAILAFACAYGMFALVVHDRQLMRIANVGRAGFTQHIISREALKMLHELDDAVLDGGPSTLIYVPSPEISFEIQHARVLTTFDLNLSADELRARVRHGRVPLLVVLSNSVLEAGGRDEIVRRSFADYSPAGWSRIRVGDWSFFYQGPWPSRVAVPHPATHPPA
jgi:hypothetical protein